MAAVTSAVIGIASAGYSAVQGFQNAKDARDDASKAENDAKKMMDDARAKAEVDYFAGLALPMDAYEAKFEANLAADQQALQVLQEGDTRNLAAGVGRVGAQGNLENEKTRIAMGEDIERFNKMKATSKEDINQQLLEMDVASARDLNALQRDKEKERALSIQQGITGLSNMASSAADLAPLYGKSSADRRGPKRGSKLGEQYKGLKPEGMSDSIFAAKIGELGLSRKEFVGLRDAQQGVVSYDSMGNNTNFDGRFIFPDIPLQ
jgi:hypothetical protein